MPQSMAQSPGVARSLASLWAGAVLFLIAVRIALPTSGPSNFAAIFLVPLYGLPLALMVRKMKHGKAMAVTLSAWFPLWFAVMVTIHAALLILTYAESDTGGIKQQWVPVATASIGAAGTMMIVGLQRWGRRTRRYALVMALGVLAVLGAVIAHKILAMQFPDTFISQEWPYNLSYICLLWQIAISPFLAWLIAAPGVQSASAAKVGH